MTGYNDQNLNFNKCDHQFGSGYDSWDDNHCDTVLSSNVTLSSEDTFQNCQRYVQSLTLSASLHGVHICNCHAEMS